MASMCAILGGAGHFTQPIVCEILRQPFFDRLQNEAGHEFGLVAIAIIGRRSATGRISHPVLAEVGRRDKRVDFADGDAVLFQLCPRREAEPEKRTLRRRVNAVLGMVHSRYSISDGSALIVVDIMRMKDGIFLEHWDVSEGALTEAESRSKRPMFGDSFPARSWSESMVKDAW
jgi:hypothetical protein